MDVFLLDVLTEMLASPLRLLAYMKLRVTAADRLMSSHELTVLGYHLAQNLWLDNTYNIVILEDSVAQDLDAAMLVRRERLPGNDTPVGILTKMRGTRYESLIKEIEYGANPAILELGFYLLSLNGASCRNVNSLLDTLTRKAQLDGKRHKFTLASSTLASTGVSFHCNPTPSIDAIKVLETDCAKNKYAQRTSQWFGVSVSPVGDVQFGITLDYPWAASEEMDQLTAEMTAPLLARVALPHYAREVKRMKLGRNDPCHCGSGLKYKKCCLS
jgi:hypothetical protein